MSKKGKQFWVGVRKDKLTGHDVLEGTAMDFTEEKCPQYDYVIGPYTERKRAEQRALSEKNKTGMFTDPFCNNGEGR